MLVQAMARLYYIGETKNVSLSKLMQAVERFHDIDDPTMFSLSMMVQTVERLHYLGEPTMFLCKCWCRRWKGYIISVNPQPFFVSVGAGDGKTILYR